MTLFWLIRGARTKRNIGDFDLFLNGEPIDWFLVQSIVNGEKKNGPTQLESGPFLDFLINRFAVNKLECELKAD
ncbi:hypothetical protein [Vibrio coralliirubri]|uniref:hypothetical protein n=1 Tax=Vibrio coralliirubri TaxID=1516159 RepID=UPI000A384042|nr:hypothetical protein [Vibrio coralliirubri]